MVTKPKKLMTPLVVLAVLLAIFPIIFVSKASGDVVYAITIEAATGGDTFPTAGVYPYYELREFGMPVEAIPDEGFYFFIWILDGGSGGSDNPTEVPLDGNHTIKPVFIPIPVYYSLNINSATGGYTVPAAGAHNYLEGTNVTVTAYPYEGYTVANWTLDGGDGGAGNPIYVYMDDNHALTPAFTDTASPTYSGISNSTDVAGAQCSFNATWDDNEELDGYIFSHNNTGTWTNSSFTQFTATPQTISSQVTLNSSVGTVVGFRWYANDTSNNWNSTDIQTLTTTPMTLSITYPQNTTYTSENIPVDFSASGGTVDVKWWNIKNGTDWVYAENQTYTTATTAENFVNGNYQFFAYANNTGAASISDSLNFTVDTPATPIELTITYPVTTTYPTSSVYVELSASGGTVDTIWYNLKAGGSWVYETNRTYTEPESLTLSDNVYTLWAWANNTEAAQDTETVTFTVDATEPAAPPAGGTTPTTGYAVSIRVVRGSAPVPSATVILASDTKTADSQGYASFSLPAGTHNLKIIVDGAIVYTSQLQITEDSVWQVDLNNPDQPPQNITPESQQTLPKIPAEIAQLGIVVIVAVVLFAFVASQSGKSTPEAEWRNKGKNVKKGERWRK